MPGDTATRAFWSSIFENSSDPAHSYFSGILAQRNIVACGGSTIQPARWRPATSTSRRFLIDVADFLRLFFALAQGDNRRDLNRLKCTVIEVALDTPQCVDHLAVSEAEADAPARPCCSSSTWRRSRQRRLLRREPPDMLGETPGRQSPGRRRQKSWTIIVPCRCAQLDERLEKTTCRRSAWSGCAGRRRAPFLAASMTCDRDPRGGLRNSSGEGIAKVQAWPSAITTPHWWMG